MKKRRDRMDKEYAKNAGNTNKTLADMRSMSRGKVQMKIERGSPMVNNRRIKPRTSWAKSIVPKSA